MSLSAILGNYTSEVDRYLDLFTCQISWDSFRACLPGFHPGGRRNDIDLSVGKVGSVGKRVKWGLMKDNGMNVSNVIAGMGCCRCFFFLLHESGQHWTRCDGGVDE